MLSESDSDHKHKDMRPTETKKSDNLVKRTTVAIQSFLNPFDVIHKENLYSLSSPTPQEIEDDVLKAEKVGEKANDRSSKID